MIRECKAERLKMLGQMFPQGIPELWCPLLTSYDSEGHIDRERMRIHMQRLSPWVRHFLVPGSTGDGWEMTPEEIYEVLDIVVEIAGQTDSRILIGVLKTGRSEARQGILDILEWLKRRTGSEDTAACLEEAKVCGFTVCPPKGKELTQAEIRSELEAVLGLGVPTALYQLPQITENEISPEVLAGLSGRYSNFFLFKDTSGADRAALSGYDFNGVFFVRGAEGGYDRWIRSNGGKYDGFLLSTANCFAKELSTVMRLLRSGEAEAARQLSGRLSGAVTEVFGEVSGLPAGNAFTNANKAMDHILAYGKSAAERRGPRLHSGDLLPEDILRKAAGILDRYGLMSEKGYLETY